MSTSTVKPYGGSFGYQTAAHAVATQDGVTFYLSAAPGGASANGGFLLVPYGVTQSLGTKVSGTAGYPGAADARGIALYNGSLYGSDSTLDASWEGVFGIGAAGALPLTLQSTATAMLPGLASGTLDPWSE